MKLYRVTDVLNDVLVEPCHHSSRKVALKQATTINARWVRVDAIELPVITQSVIISILDREFEPPCETIFENRKDLEVGPSN